MNKKHFDLYQNQLLKIRNGLLQDSDKTRDDRQPVLLDQSSVGRLSRMDALQVQAMQLETERRRNIKLQRIESALTRLQNGEFGLCIICGEDIQESRLKYDPTIPTCIACSRASS